MTAKYGGERQKRGEKPRFWWDFQHSATGPSHLVVESTDPAHPLVARILDTSEIGQKEANELVRALEEGRADYRRMARVTQTTAEP